MVNLVGRTLGKYRIIAHLGRGSMANVYKAYQPGLNRYVSIKVLNTHLVDDKNFERHFEREALVVGRLRHPNIVQVFDFDYEDDLYFLAMEFVDGPTLKDELEARQASGNPFTFKEIARIFIALCSAIDYAHARGVIHRDLKPANVMINQQGQVVLTDFGITRIIGGTQYTQTGALSGMPAYMSPEQGQGQHGDERSNIYSLGVMLYEMVTGTVPFDADTPFGIILKHISEPIPPPRRVVPDLPPSVEQIILKAMVKDPVERYQRAGEMAAALREAVSMTPGEEYLPLLTIASGKNQAISSLPVALVFISYSHDDEKEKNRLISHLGVLKRAGLIEIWNDDNIQAGADWELELDRAINRAKVAILLVTSNFLTSDVTLNSVIPRLLTRFRRRELNVFVVIAKACAWKVFDWLAKMEIRPRDGNAIWSGSDSQIDETLAAIVEEVAHLGDPTRPLYSHIPDAVLKERRIDAAVPNNAELGQSIDLLVQVRFPDSLLLGIEDWPTEQKPSSIKQKTEPINLEFPVNKQTGELRATRLKIKVITPDFKLEGSAERLIEVPPYQYSKLISFLLTPLKTGICRINIDVFSADEVYLGTIAIVTTVVAQQGLIEVEKLLYRTTSVANLPLFINVRSFTALAPEEPVLLKPISSSPWPNESTASPSATLSPPPSIPRRGNPITTIIPLITALLCGLGIIMGGTFGYGAYLQQQAQATSVVANVSATATEANVEFTRTPTRSPTTTSQIQVSPSTQDLTHTPTPRPTNTPRPPTSTPHPTPTLTPKPPTNTPLPPTATPTSTPYPIATKKATSTPRPNASATQTPYLKPTATTNLIVYVQSDGQNHSLGLVDSAGKLINGDLHRHAGAPAWSPDGERIAFFGDDRIIELSGVYEQGMGVWTIDDQGANPKQVIFIDHVKNITWSPDGTKLALEVSPPTEITEVRIVNPEDGKILMTFPGQQPTWSPNSQKLIIKTCAPGCGLWQVDFNGGNPQQLTSDSTDGYPSWSPNGQNLAFMSQNRDGNWEIYRLRLSDGKVVRLTNRSGTDITPVFGPDGQEIYLRTDALGGWRITVINLDGNDERTVKEGVGPSDDWGLARPAVR